MQEVRAMRAVFGDQVPPFSSTKSLTGHSLGATGVQEAIYCLIMMNKGFIAGSVNVETPDPELDGMPLVTAGSGVAIGLPGNFGVAPSNEAARLPAAQGLQAIVSGSCSVATNQQVMDFIKAGKPALAIDPLRIAAGVDVAAEALAWAEGHIGQGPVLVYSTAEPSAVRAIQGKLGSEKAGAMVEGTIAAIARGLVQRGVRQLIVAGGETSGACVQALGITQMRIGAQIDPGVPWCHAVAPDARDGLHITLKSGNFGSTDFFTKAFAQLQA
jgi:uncharacterized protein YgbK (DUF1537 family)